jgi:riboflavin kinase/FMN adenylyltransferase
MGMIVKRGRVIDDLGDAPRLAAIGAFDGVHVGHRRIIQELVARSRRARGLALAVTFEPHPMHVISPAAALPLLMTPAAKAAALAGLGVDVLVTLEFDRELAAMEAADFARDVLAGDLRSREVLVGWNFAFGRGGRGDPALLRRLGPGLGFSTTVFPPVTVDGTVASSTAIRGLVQRGEVAAAAALLGRPYALSGEVRRGAGRGRALGFPTANVRLPAGLVHPRAGVYAARACRDSAGHGPALPAVANIGMRPTFAGAAAPVLEVHVFDFDADLCGQELLIEFVARLRDERRFASPGELALQITRDVSAARAALRRPFGGAPD